MLRAIKYSEVCDIAKGVTASMVSLGETLEEALVSVLEDVDGITIEPDCRFTECDHGMGLAGGGGCDGDPADRECKHFTQEFSDVPVICDGGE